MKTYLAQVSGKSWSYQIVEANSPHDAAQYMANNVAAKDLDNGISVWEVGNKYEYVVDGLTGVKVREV